MLLQISGVLSSNIHRCLCHAKFGLIDVHMILYIL